MSFLHRGQLVTPVTIETPTPLPDHPVLECVPVPPCQKHEQQPDSGGYGYLLCIMHKS